MQYKILLLLVISSLMVESVKPQMLKEDRFQNAVIEVITSYTEKNTNQINSLINPQIGIFLLATPGSTSYRFHGNNLPLSDTCKVDYYVPVPINQKLREQKLSTHFKLNYTYYPYINCESASKMGLFVDTTKINREFSKLIKLNINISSADSEKKDLLRLYRVVRTMETMTRKVILVSDKSDCTPTNGISWGSIFIFYLTYIDNNWYLTAIDFTDCFLS